MSNRYRLIKEYPGSPKLGTILTHEELQYCNWNEYYQEVVEKDYEILSFYNKEGRSYYNIKNNTYFSNPASSRSLTYCLLYYQIHSVKRLSDGEI